jgi:hypothetical protein
MKNVAFNLINDFLKEQGMKRSAQSDVSLESLKASPAYREAQALAQKALTPHEESAIRSREITSKDLSTMITSPP